MEENGFVRIAGVLSDEDIADTLAIVDGIDFAEADRFLEERNGKPKQLQNLHAYRPDHFVHRLFSKRVLPALEATFGRGPDAIHNAQVFIKWPGESGATNAHQDDWYFRLDEKKRFAVTCWIAMDDADERHGCLRYAPGSHKHGLLKHEDNVKGRWRIRSGVEGFAGYVDAKPEDMVSVPVRKGDMLVHHGRTLHAANANTGDHPRRALAFITFFGKNPKEEGGVL